MSEAQSNQQSTQSSYFDLHTQGVGYLNRVRLVKPRKGEPFLACSISAMRGDADEVQYTYFDVRVSGADARKVVEGLRPDVEADKKVIVGFRIGDIFVDSFVYQKDSERHKKGDHGVMLKGRLLKVSFVKVDGQSVDLARFGVAPPPEQAPAAPAPEQQAA